MTNVIYIGLWR